MWLHAKRWILCVKTWIQFIKLLLHRLLGSWLSCVHERRVMGEIYGVPIKIIIRNRTWLICGKSKIIEIILTRFENSIVINSSYSYFCYSTSTCLPAYLPLFFNPNLLSSADNKMRQFVGRTNLCVCATSQLTTNSAIELKVMPYIIGFCTVTMGIKNTNMTLRIGNAV